MSEHLAPQQLFDGSFFAAVLATPTPTLSEAPPQSDLKTEEIEAPDEIESFDWDAYNRAFFERIPESAKRTESGRRMAEIAGTQIWISRRLPAEAIAYLLSSTPPKVIWSYLTDERPEILANATRGFQRTPRIVRQAVVRARLANWLAQNPDEIYILLMMWSFQEPEPRVIAPVRDESNPATLKRLLPVLIRKYSVEAVLAGVAFAARPKAFRSIIELIADPEKLAAAMEEPEAEPEITEETPASGPPEANSEAATYWKGQFESSETNRLEVAELLEKMLGTNEKFNRLIADQKAEIEALKNHEKSALATWEKRWTGAEKKWAAELDELKRNYERQGRKLRALEREKTDFETENRRFKKQLRHTQGLLEEERKKLSHWEAHKPKTTAAPVEALLTPNAQQSAPNKPVVVSPPTLLDELFEWRADGRPVKITPRAVRRLIDQNDEEAVFTIMQALESLALTDASLHGKFLKRLKEAGNYYPRVLTERMTRVLVDASNVARHTPNRYGKGQLRHLIEMRDELRRLDCFPILFYADASLRYHIDEAVKFRDMIERGEIIAADKGIEADEILAREARRTGAYVVTNDRLFFNKVSPDFEPPRITFRIYDGTVIVDDF